MTFEDCLSWADRELYKIHGFLSPVDAISIAAVGDIQAKLNVAGSMMEIGVFYGRSFALLSRFLRNDECGVAADLFDIWLQDGGEGRQLTSFRNTMKGLIADDKLMVLKGDSADISPETILQRCGPIRLMSIDGGHEAHHLYNDAEKAAALLSDQGVIIFDDFFNAQYPDLTVAILKAFEGILHDFRPFLITRNKLYVSRATHCEQYMTELRNPRYLRNGVRADRFAFLGGEVLHFWQPTPARFLYQGLATWGLGGVARTAVERSGAKQKFAR